MKKHFDSKTEFIVIEEYKTLFGTTKYKLYVSLDILYNKTKMGEISIDKFLLENITPNNKGIFIPLLRIILEKLRLCKYISYCNDKYKYPYGYLTVKEAIKILARQNSIHKWAEEELKITLLNYNLYNKYYDTAIHKKHRTTIRIFNRVIW